MPGSLVAYTTAPLYKAPYKSDVIHGISAVLQSYHLEDDWCTACKTRTFVIDDANGAWFRYLSTHNLFLPETAFALSYLLALFF